MFRTGYAWRAAFNGLNGQLLVLLSRSAGLALVLQPDHGDLRESLFELRRTQLVGHALHDVFGDVALATVITFDADLGWHIEENGVGLVAKVVRQLYPTAALVRREIGRVHIVPWTPRQQPRAQHGAQGGKHKVLVALLGDVVEQQNPDHVARQRQDIVPLEPCALAGPGQSDGKHDCALGLLRRLSGAAGGRSRGFGGLNVFTGFRSFGAFSSWASGPR